MKVINYLLPFFLSAFAMIAAPIYARDLIVRDFYEPLTRSDEIDIAYIVTTLAETPYLSLLGKKRELNKRGDNVRHVHPLRFLLYILSNENLKSALHVVRKRDGIVKGLGVSVWDHFKDNLFDNLSKETKYQNITPGHVQDFAKTLNIDPAQIMGYVQSQSWSKFMDTLFKLLPRKGNTDRYGQ